MKRTAQTKEIIYFHIKISPTPQSKKKEKRVKFQLCKQKGINKVRSKKPIMKRSCLSRDLIYLFSKQKKTKKM